MTETISASRAFTARRVAAKVPEITVVFWLLKLLSTGIGEVVSGYGGSVSTMYGAIVITAGFVLAMWLQLRQRRYHAPYYWSAVLAVAVFGTMAADGIHADVGFGYAVTTPLFAFWFAYIVTRPLGASFSDWFSKPVSGTGLGLGNGTVSLIGLAVFLPIVAWVTIAKIDIQPGHGPHPHPETHHDEHAVAHCAPVLAPEAE